VRASRLSTPVLRGAALALVALASCRTQDLLGNVGGAAVGQATGSRTLGNIARVALGSATEQVQQLNTQFTPEQEYYLGRSVAANALARYGGLDPDEERQAYVRTVGKALVALSTRLPATFGGWNFAVLASDEPNGVAGPGGFVLVTRGAVRACRTEDELAALLAHEIAHVSLKHGEATVRQGRGFSSEIATLAKLAAAAADANDRGFTGGLVNFFGEVVGEATKNAMEHAYGAGAELDADEEAAYLLYEADYDAAGMQRALEGIAAAGAKAGEAHASPAERARRLGPVSARYGGKSDPAGVAARAARFRP
jgi:predicted Zn-dependent protease